MPRKPIDYSKTIIYKLVCKDLDVKDLYVGHTTNWVKRKGDHKSCCSNSNCKKYNYKIYKTIRENGGWDNWEMVEVEKYPCNDEREASARERYWYEQLYASMNTIRPIRTDEERKEYVKEYIKEYNKRPDVKEHKKEQGKEWYEKNREEKIKKEKERYEKNKEKILLKNKIKITCSCGSEIVKRTKLRHERTKKHQNYIESLN